MADTGEQRHARLCDVCGQLDDDPKHVQGVPPNYPGAIPSDAFLDALPDNTPPRAVKELMDPGTVIRHQDCCAAQGCEVCKATETAHGGKRGPDLLASILDGAVDHLSGSQPAKEE